MERLEHVKMHPPSLPHPLAAEPLKEGGMGAPSPLFGWQDPYVLPLGAEKILVLPLFLQGPTYVSFRQK